ncbi:unnamed protein product, partial [Polarella glacialis]
AKRKSVLQANALEAGEHLQAAEARRRSQLAEVEGGLSEQQGLDQKVQSLEAEIAGQVVSRVRLEALLRQTEMREVELRRAVDAAEEARRQRTRQFSQAGPVEK